MGELVLFIELIAIGFLIYFAIDYIRVRDIMKYCEEHGFTFDNSPNLMLGVSEPYNVLNKGVINRTHNRMFGHLGDIEISIVDFEANKKNQHNRRGYNITQKFTLCQLHKKDCNFPAFFMRDEDAALDSTASLGGKDIDFDEDKTFSNKFVLQGKNESNIIDYFSSPKVRNAFVKYHKQGYKYESKGECFLLYVKGYAFMNKRIEMMNDAIKIFNEITSVKYKTPISE